MNVPAIMAAAISIVLMLTISAFAQPPQSPTEQALGNKLLQEVSAGLSCSANLIAAQAELDKAKARVKELEPKPEDKKPDEPAK